MIPSFFLYIMPSIEQLNEHNEVIVYQQYVPKKKPNKKRKITLDDIRPFIARDENEEDPEQPPGSPQEPSSIPNDISSASLFHRPRGRPPRNEVGNHIGPNNVCAQPLLELKTKLDPYRRIGFQYSKKRKVIIDDINESEDEEEEKHQQESYLRSDDEDQSDQEETEEDQQDQEDLLEKKRLELQREQIDAYHATYKYNPKKIEHKRETYWILQDIQKQWCFICAYKHNTKQKNRFRDLDELQMYWDESIVVCDLRIIIHDIQDKYLADFRQWLPIRSIDPYTNKPKPPHWWSTESIAQHFLQHHINTHTYSVFRKKKCLELTDDVERNLRKHDVLTGEILLDPRLFTQRKSLLDEIRMFDTYLQKTHESNSAQLSLLTAMNQSASKV
jgi:hypothetical protein